ncbi:MAG: hypothetical protein V2I43_14910, partial [Parvularcula sp.]|nr:hypothetical protein [Parvularcula sp.]
MIASLVVSSVLPLLQAEATSVVEREPCSMTVTVDASSLTEDDTKVAMRFDRETEEWTVLNDDQQPDDDSDVTRPPPQDHYADLMKLIAAGGEPRVESDGGTS